MFITELLGLERLRRISAAARERADAWTRQFLSVEGERKGIKQMLTAVPEIEKPNALAAELEAVTQEVEKIEVERHALTEDLAGLRAREVERKAIELQRRDLMGQLNKILTAIGNLEQQLAEDRKLLVRQAGTADVTGKLRAMDGRIDELHRQMAETKAIETANREVDVRIRTADVSLCEKRGELERSRRESAELRAVPCGGKGWYAACPKIQRSIQAREGLPELERAIVTLAEEVEAEKARLSVLPADRGKLMKDLEQCQRERRNLEAIRREQEERRIVEARVEERNVTRQRLIEEKATLECRAEQLASSLSSFDGLDSRISEISRQLQELASHLGQQRQQREQLIARKAQAEQRMRQIEEARQRAQALEAQLRQAHGKRDDYDYMARAFGADEMQLCEIQAAGPAVSAVVNDLLEGCFENKFEVRFRTQRPRADGKGMADDFDIEVRNKTLDRICLVDELSGGQFVLVNEAVNLGIAIYNMRQAESVRHETLFRDETVGALDARNAKEYVRMLRRAMEIGGFYQVIFICHAPQVWEMADRILYVANGRITLENPAEAAA